MKHKDSTGGQGIIKAGDIQIMSAGTGVQHSEANESVSEPVTLFQVWVFPKKRNIEPRYDQRTFNISDRQNKWQVVVSPDENDNALWINQDARFALTTLEADKSITYQNLFKGNGVYLVVIKGKVEINGQQLHLRDAAAVTDADEILINATEDSELLAIEVPLN